MRRTACMIPSCWIVRLISASAGGVAGLVPVNSGVAAISPGVLTVILIDR